MGVLSNLLGRIREQRKPSAQRHDKVVFDATAVTRHMADGRTETVDWDDLQEVSIMTNDEGPFVEDMYWLLRGAKGGCAVPNSAEGMSELLTRLQALPGFDNEAVVRSIASTSYASFDVWKRA